MLKKNIMQICVSGIFVSFGVVIPQFFHAVGGAGAIFLPMHIPVLSCGFFLTVPFALAVGMLTPLLSSLLFGMPPVFPNLAYMVFELSTYAVSVSFFCQLLMKLNVSKLFKVMVSLLLSMILGRIVAFSVYAMLLNWGTFDGVSPIAFLYNAIAKGTIGLCLQFVFIPIVVLAMSKHTLTLNYRYKNAVAG